MAANRKLLAVMLAAVLLVMTGCSRLVYLPQEKTTAISFTDSLGHAVSLPSRPVKVAALSASLADIWLLAGGDLVGVTADAPERGLALSEHTELIGTVKKPNAEALLALSPDLVLLSADIESHYPLAETLQAAKIPCAFCRVETFTEYLALLEQFTSLTGEKEAYEKHGTALSEAVESVIAYAKGQTDSPRVLLIRALSTRAKALPQEDMVSQMVVELGADNMAARYPSLLEELSMEAVLQEDPDVILVVPMGDSREAVKALEASVGTSPAWRTLKAVQNGRYHVLDQELFHYKPNKRWAESYQTLCKILYGECDES